MGQSFRVTVGLSKINQAVHAPLQSYNIYPWKSDSTRFRQLIIERESSPQLDLAIAVHPYVTERKGTPLLSTSPISLMEIQHSRITTRLSNLVESGNQSK